jgi:Protein kinase domain
MPELPLVGEDFAGYRLRSVLGRGGMSIVYQAENPRLRNLIALKVLAPDLADNEVFRTRFRAESQAAASLDHPNVIPIHDFGSCDGLLYIAMRYVSGTDLRRLIAEHGWLPPDTAVYLLEQAARALDAAHRSGLVHRDVKPGNLLIAQGNDAGDPDHVYLADFGITKHVGGRTGLTAVGMILGTLHYMPPEQIEERPVLGTADQYSLGCVLYECLTGQAPFVRSTTAALLWAHIHEFPGPASRLRPELPPAIDDVFARVLAKAPLNRYANCREFIAAAADALGTAEVRPPGRRSSEIRAQVSRAQGVSRAHGEFQSAVGPSHGQRGPGGSPVSQPHQETARVFPPTKTAAPGAATKTASPGDGTEVAAPGDPSETASPGDPSETADPGDGTEVAEPGDPSETAGPGDDATEVADPGDARRLSFPPSRSRRPARARSRERQGVRTAAILLGFAVAAAGGAAVAVLASQSDNAPDVVHRAASSSPHPRQLFSALEKAEARTSMLPMSTCVQQTTTRVQCTNPTRAIATVTFQTYPSLATLYSDYQQIVGNLTGHRPFAAVENIRPCSSVAPDPTGESTWNHSDQYFTNYSVAQLASGKVSTGTVMGRLFCGHEPDGSAAIVWTQDAGNLLGYATGGAASHEQVWNWFYVIHDKITFPGQSEMIGSSMSPAATATATATAST